MSKETVKKLITAILDKNGPTSKVKLAKLILFSDINHFNKTGESITGDYYVRLKNGPVIAFFDEVLNQNVGNAWELELRDVPIYSEGRVKKQHVYKTLTKEIFTDDINKTINDVVKKYGRKSGTELSRLSHDLAAWKYSEPNEPIYIAELSAKNEAEYFALVDLIEDTNEDDGDLEEKIPSSI